MLMSAEVTRTQVRDAGHRLFVANGYAAGFDCAVPGKPKIAAVDFGRGADARLLAAASISHGRSGSFYIERHFLGDAVHGQIADELEAALGASLDSFGYKTNAGVILHVEEVGAAQVLVTALVGGVDRVGVNLDLDVGLRRIGGIEFNGAFDVGELAAYPAHHHVANLESDIRMRAVDAPLLEIGKRRRGGRQYDQGQQGNARESSHTELGRYGAGEVTAGRL